MEKDVCGTCRSKNWCMERSRLYPCLSYKKGAPRRQPRKLQITNNTPLL